MKFNKISRFPFWATQIKACGLFRSLPDVLENTWLTTTLAHVPSVFADSCAEHILNKLQCIGESALCPQCSGFKADFSVRRNTVSVRERSLLFANSIPCNIVE